MDIFQIALITATFLCALVAGFLLAFVIVVMPGLGNLNDGQFIRSFQSIDRVIQNGQPIFMVIWVGSIIALITTAVLSIGPLDGSEFIYIALAVVFDLIGVQLPTIMINVPLNNKLQTYDVKAMDEAAKITARQNFESRWNSWNIVRTVASSLTTALLITLLCTI